MYDLLPEQYVLFINGPVVMVMAEQPVMVVRSLLDLLQEVCKRVCLIVTVSMRAMLVGAQCVIT